MADPAQQVRHWLDTYDTPTASVAHLLCDRHPTNAIAVTEVNTDLTTRDLTYGELTDRSSHLAADLAHLGVQPGDHVATLMEKGHDLVTTAMAIWRLGAIHVPLFTALAPTALAPRLADSTPRVVVCDPQHLPKLHSPDITPPPPTIAVYPTPDHTPHNTHPLTATHGTHPPTTTSGETPFILLHTSSPAGQPRGVPVPLRALAAFHAYHVYGLDVTDHDTYWNATDPGWAYGLYYGIVSPLLAGHRTILLRAGFDAELTLDVLSSLGVTNFTAAPTVYRAMRATLKSMPPEVLPRRLSSAGEPLTPEVAEWAHDAFGVPIHDTYGQTELGICVATPTHPTTATPPGAAGMALPGWHVTVLDPISDVEAPPGELGRIAIDTDPKASPLMWFTGYHRNSGWTTTRFSPDRRWYLTGDTGRRDSAGHLYLASRDDDVIVTGGYRVSPFDVESTLLRHPSVIEAAAYATPDDIYGQAVAASVVLHDGWHPSTQLATELQELVRTHFATHAYPRRVSFVDALPKSASGKIQRGRLRQP